MLDFSSEIPVIVAVYDIFQALILEFIESFL